MPFGFRRRLQPSTTTGTLVHKILALVGLGPADDDDAEAMFLVADRLTYVTLLSDVDEGEHHSQWHSCKDRSLIRIFVEYGDASETRTFIIAMRGHIATGGVDGDGNYVTYSRVIEPDNTGYAHDADLVTLGRFKGIDTGEGNINCLGMDQYKLILLPKSGGTHVDAYGSVA